MKATLTNEQFRAQWMVSFEAEIRHPIYTKRLAKLGIVIKKKQFRADRCHFTPSSHTGKVQIYRNNINESGCIDPYWQIFSSECDQIRTRSQHKKMVDILANTHAGKTDLKGSGEDPDYYGTIFLLNIISKLNPNVEKIHISEEVLQ